VTGGRPLLHAYAQVNSNHFISFCLAGSYEEKSCTLYKLFYRQQISPYLIFNSILHLHFSSPDPARQKFFMDTLLPVAVLREDLYCIVFYNII